MLDINKIDEICIGIDEHLRKLESFTDLLKEVKISLQMLKESQEKTFLYELAKVKLDVADISEQLKKRGLPMSNDYEKSLHQIRTLLDGKEWPEAVNADFICDSEDKAAIRAEHILDMLIGESLKGKKFLDFGCGQGQTLPAALAREAAFAFGYDIDASQYKFSPEWFSHNFEDVRKHAPYDIILLHDVLDHSILLNPAEILKQARSVLSSHGRIYVRNHPWCSRHGGHLYLQKNKAFLHLILDDVELTRCAGIQGEHNVKVLDPINTYRNWIEEAGLSVKTELTIKSEVEEFFLEPSVIRDKLNQLWHDSDCIANYMEIDFVEYVLEMNEAANQQIF